MLKQNHKNTALLALPLLFVLQGCVSDGEGGDSSDSNITPAAEADYSEIFAAVADNVFISSYQAFADVTQSWDEAVNSVSNYCAAIDTGSEAATLATAQGEWRNVMAQWQQIEAYQFGPITDNASNMRNRIYSWPDFISTCTIDQQVVAADGNANYSISSVANQARGLDTLEYLLFNDDLTHTCPSQITATQNWNNLSESDRKAARCGFAEHVAADVHANANTLLQSWLSTGGNFRQSLIDSGNVGGAFDSQTAAMNALSDALFYLDKNAKDGKLGSPAGLHPDCNSLTCPDERESQYSENSLENLKNNLIGFRDVYSEAFEPQLDAKNFAELGDEIRQYADDAITAIENNSGTLADDIALIVDAASEAECINAANNPDAVSANFSCTLHGKIKRLTDKLKGDFITVISLSLPSRVEGDND